MRSIPVRLLARLGVVVLLCGFLGHGDGVAGAQSGGVAVRFHGRVTLGNPSVTEVTAAERQAFAPGSRMLLQVVVARDADDVTVCARTMITLDQPYEIEIPARPPCVSQTVADPAPQFLFLVNGVQAGATGRVIVNPNLSAPQTLGASYERDLVVPFGAVAPNAPLSTGSRLIRVRYWGTVTLAGRPAPAGTEVRVVTQQGGRLCGTGAVENGLYVVDVPATPGECTHRGPNDSTIFLAFVVNGERVIAHGRDIASPAYIAPDTLAKSYRRDLEGRNPPPADVFAADACDEDPGAVARQHAAWLYVGRAQPLPCIAWPENLIVRNAVLYRKVRTCLRAYDVAKDHARGLAVRDVFETLYQHDPLGPYITIVEDASLGLTYGDTSPLFDADAAAVREGRPADARVRVHPGATANLLSAIATINEWQGFVHDYDFCAVLLHELVHAIDFITGKVPPTSIVCDFGNGLRLEAHEVRSMAAENAYRLSRGMLPRESYSSHRLPDILIHPTPANWMRYQAASLAGEWEELCR